MPLAWEQGVMALSTFTVNILSFYLSVFQILQL